jgi:hypothetical protein
MKGEKYERVEYVFEDDFYTDKTCNDCLSIVKEFFCGGCCIDTMYEDFELHLEEIDGQIKSECLERLTPRAKAKVIDMIDSIWAREANYIKE